MTPHEKALEAVNRRLERLRADLASAPGETGRPILLQAIMVTFGIGEELNGYIDRVADEADRRKSAMKEANDTLTARHADLLASGHRLLEQFKANPSDREKRREIDTVQRQMEEIQKTLRHGAHDMQRELAPRIAMIDRLADTVRRLAEADSLEGLARAVHMAVEQAHELFSALPGKNVIDADGWEKSARAEIAQAADFQDAYARAGFQVWRGAALMGLALSPMPPKSMDDANHLANEAVAIRLKQITSRFAP